jgi:hypothetical protein
MTLEQKLDSFATPSALLIQMHPGRANFDKHVLGWQELGKISQVDCAGLAAEEDMIALTLMEYSHWLIIAGSLLLLFGLAGLAARHRIVEAEPDPTTADSQCSDLDTELTPSEIYHRAAKEKRRARWADTPHEELLDADSKTQHPT